MGNLGPFALGNHVSMGNVASFALWSHVFLTEIHKHPLEMTLCFFLDESHP
jgi:hypothetical protein